MCGDTAFAIKLAKSAKKNYAEVQNFDQEETLAQFLKKIKPCLLILDFEKREAESFKFLNKMSQNADPKEVPVIGYIAQGKSLSNVSEAQEAGCDRVYTKSEFGRSMDDILMRYSL